MKSADNLREYEGCAVFVKEKKAYKCDINKPLFRCFYFMC